MHDDFDSSIAGVSDPSYFQGKDKTKPGFNNALTGIRQGQARHLESQQRFADQVAKASRSLCSFESNSVCFDLAAPRNEAA